MVRRVILLTRSADASLAGGPLIAIGGGVTLPPPALSLEIDAEALAANWRTLDSLSGSARAGAAVKADAYGLGVDHVVPVLRAAGARDFFVAHWSEVPAVLRHVPPSELSVLHGVVSGTEAAYARQAGVRPVINSVQQARCWIEAGGGPCDLMVDTGINRLGISPAQLGDPVVARLEVHTLLSHLASADEDVAQNADQLARLRSVANQMPHRVLSLANSAGIALGPEYACDLTRPGISLYGGLARPELAGRIRQVAFPRAVVLQRRRIEAGDCVGYNATYRASSPIEVATVAIGYADGFLRCRGPGAAMQHEGAALPVVGRVSMDMTVVDCSRSPSLSVGDYVDIPFDLAEESARSGLSQYELLTLLGKRYHRRS
jgi:alanine racemase